MFWVAPVLAEEAAPARIVSINLCADELLLGLQAQSQLQSVTWLVKDPHTSWAAAEAANIPGNRGSAEEVMQFRPDLVVAGAWSTPATRLALQRLEIPVITLDHPQTFDAAVAQIRELADVIGRVAEGEALVGELEQRLARLSKASGEVTALFLQSNGVTSGTGTLPHDLMRLAGLTNAASVASYARFSLEQLVREPPDLLVINDLSHASPALANEVLRHRVIARAFPATRIVNMPGQAWSCGSQYMLDAVEHLAAAAHSVQPNRS